METLSEVLGWAGMLMIITAYALMSFKKISPASALYQWMNLLGAVGVGVNVFYKQSWPAVVLQVIWGLITILTLIKKK